MAAQRLVTGVPGGSWSGLPVGSWYLPGCQLALRAAWMTASAISGCRSATADRWSKAAMSSVAAL